MSLIFIRLPFWWSIIFGTSTIALNLPDDLIHHPFFTKRCVLMDSLTELDVYPALSFMLLFLLVYKICRILFGSLISLFYICITTLINHHH